MTSTVLLAVVLLFAATGLLLGISIRNALKSDRMETLTAKLDSDLSKIDAVMRDEFSRGRSENQNSFRENREELNTSFKLLGDTLIRTVNNLAVTQTGQFDTFARQMREINETIERRLSALQEGNDKKLEEMRKIVDEKLRETVEKRFDESFKLISGQLEQVHKGLGEMQILASGVGDLKKVLSNVKTRGILGEIQLGAILEQILPRGQYEQNAAVKPDSLERVEYAIKLPGKDGADGSLLLPIDSKFPTEDYQRLMDAYENMPDINPKDVEAISKQFENSVKKNARDIRDRYIDPPATTDFAIMFVPSEGLYAEILRRAGLFETLQRDFKVTVVGPANLVAFLNSLQMGFRTLAIEKRSGEVWEILNAVKTQFGAFGDILDKTKKKLQEAANTIDKAGVRSRAIERKLKSVQELPLGQSKEIEDESGEPSQDDEPEPFTK
jgi:DNA recombination protein RmuC